MVGYFWLTDIFDWQDQSDENEDIWDDTALIKAYDKAVALIKVISFISEIITHYYQ